MKIIVGNDHAGYEMKVALVKWLQTNGYTVENIGTNSSASMDYPDVVHPLANRVEAGEFDFGLLICGSGQGVSCQTFRFTPSP